MLEKLDEKLADPGLYEATRAAERDKWLLKHGEAREAMDRAEALWMEALEKLEMAENA
jgi:ATP-binding cassette subfamily F protein 3